MSTSYDSLRIAFTGAHQLELQHENVAAPAANQLLVQTRKTLISTGTESIIFTRNFGPGTHWDNWVKYPFYPGYLSAGEVVEVGADLTDWKIGDRVASRSNHRQFHLQNPHDVLRIPDGVADEDAAWFGLGTITQNGVRKAHHQLGDTVVIIGLGLLGQLVTQYARINGASQVIAIDTAPMRLEMATAHGATHALQMGVAEARERVFELTEGFGADVVYDVTGHPDVLSPALGLARRFGTLILLGDTGTPSQQRLSSDVISRGVQIKGAHDVDPPPARTDWTRWTKSDMARLFFTYLERGQMRVNDLVTHRYSPTQALEAFTTLQERRAEAMGVVFDWTQLDS